MKPFSPSIYLCEVTHQRLLPKKYYFKHNVFFFCFDITQPFALENSVLPRFLLPLIGIEKPGLYSYYENDHLPEPSELSLPERIKCLLTQHGYGDEAEKCQRILLITQLRVLGYGFNPVSFYFCFDKDDKPLCSVAEVGNTFGEMKPYVIPVDSLNKNHFVLETSKLFYVSPFSELTDQFLFNLQLPGKSLCFSIDNFNKDGEPLLCSSMTGQEFPLTKTSLLKATLGNPLVTLQIIGWIHWHALRIWMKGVPHFIKEANPQNQTGLFHPHAKTFQGVPL